MTGADLLIRAVAECGIDTMFGLPGYHTIFVYDALHRNPCLKHFLVRHEQAAAFMADGYARASGRMAAVLTTAGPGATNALSGVANAFSDSVPMLVFTGETDTSQPGRGWYHELDKLGIFERATKWSARADSAAAIPCLVAEAVCQARSGRPGPVHIELPEQVLRAPGEASTPSVADPPRPEAEVKAVRHAAALLSDSEALVIMAGGGVASAGAEAELRELAEALHAPVVTSIMGRGALSDHHRLSCGYAQSPAARRALAEADCMVAVGCRFAQVTTSDWSMRVADRLIHIDIDERVFDLNYPASVRLRGDAKTVLRQLLSALADQPARPGGHRQIPSVSPEERGSDEGWQFAAALRKAVPDEGIIASDPSILSYRLVEALPVYGTRRFFHPAGYIAMGFAIPAAMGAKVAMPERPVVAVTGDGSYLMSAVELATAAQYDIRIVCVVDNNRELGTIRGMQEKQFDGRTGHVYFGDTHDLQAFARSLGATAEKAATAVEAAEAVARALDQGLGPPLGSARGESPGAGGHPEPAERGPHVIEIDRRLGTATQGRPAGRPYSVPAGRDGSAQ